MKDIQDKLDKLAKNSDYIVANPDTIKRLRSKGLPIKSLSTTYEEYLDKLFENKRKSALEFIHDLPRLDENIANATIQALYEEIKEAFVLGMPGAAITLSIILLELGLKYSLYEKRLENDPNSKWEHIENLNLKNTAKQLRDKKIISKREKADLDNFNDSIRNSYLHYNIKELIKDMEISELPNLNIETGEVTIEKNVKPSGNRFLWFSAKRVLDKESAKYHVGFCVNWVNKLLS